MKVRSAKSKGRRFQQEIARKIREFFSLEPSDVVSAAASVPGEDIILSNFAQSLFPFSIECKKREHLNIWEAIAQSERNKQPGTTPIVVFSRNHDDTYVTIDLESFLSLVKYGVGSLCETSGVYESE